MEALIAFLGTYGTRAIGVLLGVLTTLVGTGIIPDAQAKYYMAAIAVLTYIRGQFTSNAYDRGMVVGANNPTEMPPNARIVLTPSQPEKKLP
jgi:hypothetical protein